ncbi:oxidoreductase [Mycena maculata]|uniref:Oxidoreductase n=1 Tax=Mycena maculata TaxID=230809 RepID=A0AAD7HP88_9AGAR|nr:oxidoreductase [Mycena maculata]
MASTTDSYYVLNDGSKIPAIAFGTGTALFNQDCTKAIKFAIKNNFTHLDGAQVYGNEKWLGKGIAESGKTRDQLYIVTKLHPKLEVPPGKTLAEHVKESLKISIKTLFPDSKNLDDENPDEHVDLFLVHAPPRPFDPTNETHRELWKAMEAVKTAKLATSIGVSNFTVDDLEAIKPGFDPTSGITLEVVPSVNQIELHPYVWKTAAPIVEYCLSRGIRPAAYGGLIPLGRARALAPAPDSDDPGPVEAVLATIIIKDGPLTATPAQVLTKWLLQKGAIVVTTTSKSDDTAAKRLDESLKAPSLLDLTAEQIKEIDGAAGEEIRRKYMGHIFTEWDNKFKP